VQEQRGHFKESGGGTGPEKRTFCERDAEIEEERVLTNERKESEMKSDYCPLAAKKQEI